jgi:ABC-2 type transport system permease protein
MDELFHILFYKLKSNLKITTVFNLSGIIKTTGSGLLYVVFAVAAFYLTRTTINYLLTEAHIGLFLLHRFISMALFVFFMTVSIGNIIVAYTTLYRSSEVSYLFTKPVSFTNVFIIKFLDNFFYSSATLFFIGIAVIIGYGSYFNMSLSFYLIVVFLIFIPFMLIAASVAGKILFALMRLSSLIGAMAVVSGLIAAYIGSIYLFFKFTNPSLLVQNVMQFYPYTDQYFVQFEPKFSYYLPNQWVADFLYWTAKGNSSNSFLCLIQILLSAILLFSLLVLIAKLYYRKSWLQSLELKFIKRRQPSARILFFQKRSILDSQTEVLLKKEILQFLREPMQYLHLGVMILFMGIFTISIMHVNLGKVPPFMYAVFYTVVFLFTAFLLSSLAVRFVYPAVSIEARYFWKIKSSPISLSKFFRIKYLVYLIPTIVLGSFLILFSNWEHRGEPQLITCVFVSVLFLSITLITLNISAGTFFSNFGEKNPIRVASTQGASLTFLLSLVYLVIASALIFNIFDNYFISKKLKEYLSGGLILNSIFISFLVSSVISSIAYIIGLRSLHRDLS